MRARCWDEISNYITNTFIHKRISLSLTLRWNKRLAGVCRFKESYTDQKPYLLESLFKFFKPEGRCLFEGVESDKKLYYLRHDYFLRSLYFPF